MRAALATMREVLEADREQAAATTRCRRRGTAARAAYVSDDGTVIQLASNVNGSSWCSAQERDCGCAHAEQKLITNLLRNGEPPLHRMTLLTTLEPCVNCANLILESGLFSTVAFLVPYWESRGRQILTAGGISVMDASGPFTTCSTVPC